MDELPLKNHTLMIIKLVGRDQLADLLCKTID